MVKFNFEQAEARMRELNSQLASMPADDAQRENAQSEYDNLFREYNLQKSIMEREKLTPKREISKNQQFLQIVREAKKGGQTDFVLSREVTSSIVNSGDLNNITTAGMPVTIEDVLPPLEMGTIYDKVGIKIATGIHGQLIWPALDTAAKLSVAGETVALTDSDLDFSKITAAPKRLGITIAVTNEALNDASFDLQGLVLNQIRAALGRTINEAFVKNVSTLAGPFYGTQSAREAVTFAATYPTYAELLSMKGAVANNGVQMDTFCYIMSAVTYAHLEATPITAGDARFIIENGKIAGYPVFVTNSTNIADGTVYAGCAAYAALAQHGEVHLVVDPYTKAANNEVVFTLNTNVSLTTLKYEAFAIGKSA